MLPVLIPRRLSPCFAHPAPRRPAQAGFALIITIILMAFLVLLMVSMASLTRVETQIAANSQQAAAARENALLALNLALGKLQATAGPDQRITATGEILATTQPAKKKWTGVWNSQTGAQVDWLVSDPTPNATAAAPSLTTSQNYDDSNGTVRLVGTGSTDLTVTAPVTGNEIILAKQPLKASGVPGQGSGPTTLGNYAWWIGDEGVKARINLADPMAERPATTKASPAVDAFTPTVAQKRQSLMVPGRVGGELLAANNPTDPAYPAYLGDSIYPAAVPDPGMNSPTATNANFQRDLGKLLAENQVELLGTGFTSAMRKNRFHDFTVNSRGVLADVSEGGLKKDLTAGLLNSTIPANAPANATPLITVPAGLSNIPAKLPAWGALRSYMQMQNSITGATPTVNAIAPTDTSMGISPVILHHQLYCHAAIETLGTSAPKNTLSLMYFPAVVLWNPYDVTLKAQDYAGRFYFSASNNTATYFVQVYAEFTTTTPGKTSWKWSQGTLGTYINSSIGRGSKGIKLQCPDLAPGQAIVLTPASTQNYLTATNSTPLTLSPGWRTNFWYEEVVTTTPLPSGCQAGESPNAASTLPPASTDTLTRLAIAAGTNTTGFDLYVDPSLKTTPPYSPTGTTAQRVMASTFASGAGAITSPSTTAFYIAATNQRSVQVISPGQRPTGLLPSSATAPALGVIVSQKMTNANDTGRETAWVGQYNPAAQVVGRGILDNMGSSGGSGYGSTANCVSSGFTKSNTAFAINVNDITTGEAFVGYDHSPGPTQTILFHLPRNGTGVLSLAALQHANVHPLLSQLYVTGPSVVGYCASSMPAYAIGNAYAAPQIKLNAANGFLQDIPISPGVTMPGNSSQVTASQFDLSLLLNRLLWDKYYFSGVPTGAQLAGSALTDAPAASNYYSANHRHKLYDPSNQGLSGTKTAALQDYDQAAANLLVEGAFNINSTSREAWRALLASARNAPVVNQDGTIALANNSQTTPFPRSPYPLKSTAYPALTETNADVYVGFRNLTDAQLDELATAIVAQIKARAADNNYGPFRSLADFVNRRPEAGDGSTISPYQLKGLLQAAIDSTTINVGFNKTADLSGLSAIPAATSAYFDLTQVKAAGAISRAAGLPGFLTQADVLQQLGPVLSARSDTFRVRTYGEVVNPATTGIVSRAWCEAVVQRLPEYIDNNADAPEASPSAGTPNATFGRRFKIVSFRWLSPSDL